LRRKGKVEKVNGMGEKRRCAQKRDSKCDCFVSLLLLACLSASKGRNRYGTTFGATKKSKIKKSKIKGKSKGNETTNDQNSTMKQC
jgi:hypothetical protein